MAYLKKIKNNQITKGWRNKLTFQL